jgi:uncharacterized coiled-coil protein SlyX
MKKWSMVFIVSLALAFAGCTTVSDIKSQVSTKVTSITSNVDPNLVAKVPDDKRGGFPKAEFAVKVAEEKIKLAKMKNDLAALQKKITDYEEDLADTEAKDAGLDYDIVKLGAVDAAGLGKKEDNIKALTKLKLKKVDLQSDRIKTEGHLTAVKQQIQDLTEKIKAQEEQLKGLTAEKEKPEKAADVAAEKNKAEKGKAAEEKPGDKAPEAAPAPAAPVAPAAPATAGPSAPAEKSK